MRGMDDARGPRDSVKGLKGGFWRIRQAIRVYMKDEN